MRTLLTLLMLCFALQSNAQRYTMFYLEIPPADSAEGEIHVDLEVIDNLMGDTLHPDMLQNVSGKCSCLVNDTIREKNIKDMHLEEPCLSLYNTLHKGEKLEISMVHFTHGGKRTYANPFTIIKTHD